MSGASLFPVALATAIALYIAVIDFRELRIPNRILLPGLATTISAMAIVAIGSGQMGNLARALGGAFLSTAIFFTIHLMNPKGLGMGDVKFAALIGLTLSWISFPIGLLGLAISWLTAASFSVVALLFKDRRLDRLVPFGPFMFFGLILIEFGLLL